MTTRPPAPDLVIIPCGGAKGSYACPAAQMYTGTYHRQAQRTAHRLTPLGWRILSAKHGLLHPASYAAIALTVWPHACWPLKGMTLLPQKTTMRDMRVAGTCACSYPPGFIPPPRRRPGQPRPPR